MNTLEMKNRANKAHVLDMLEKARRIILGEVVIQELEEINKERAPRSQVPPDWPELDPIKAEALINLGFSIDENVSLVFPISETGTATIAIQSIDVVMSAVSKGFPVTAPRGPKALKPSAMNGGRVKLNWDLPEALGLPENFQHGVVKYMIDDRTRKINQTPNDYGKARVKKGIENELKALRNINELM